MAKYLIKDAQGNVVNTIVADLAFVQANYDHWEDAAEPTKAAKPKTLTHLEFIRLCQSAGGASPAQVVAAKSDATLAYMWLEFEMSQTLERDDPGMQQGLSLMESLGYLLNGAQSVIDNWPVA